MVVFLVVLNFLHYLVAVDSTASNDNNLIRHKDIYGSLYDDNSGYSHKVPQKQYNPYLTNDPSTAITGSSNRTGKKKKDLFGLDLSGEWLCHVMGCDGVSDDVAAVNERVQRGHVPPPLFRYSSNPNYTPSVLMRVNYDFGEVWYGVQRFLTTLRWQTKTTNDNSNILVPFTTTQTVVDNNASNKNYIIPSVVSFGVEKGLCSKKKNLLAAQVTTEWHNLSPIMRRGESPSSTTFDHPAATSLSGKWNFSNGIAHFSLLTPLHKRIRLLAKLSCLTSKTLKQKQQPSSLFLRRDYHCATGNDTTRGYFHSHLPPRATDRFNRDDWWIPDCTVNPMGVATCKNSGRFGIPGTDKCLGFRLSVSRQLPWNVFGLSCEDEAADDPPTTLVRLEVCGTGLDGKSITTVSLQTSLEAFLESTNLYFIHEHVVSL